MIKYYFLSQSGAIPEPSSDVAPVFFFYPYVRLSDLVAKII